MNQVFDGIENMDEDAHRVTKAAQFQSMIDQCLKFPSSIVDDVFYISVIADKSDTRPWIKNWIQFEALVVVEDYSNSSSASCQKKYDEYYSKEPGITCVDFYDDDEEPQSSEVGFLFNNRDVRLLKDLVDNLRSFFYNDDGSQKNIQELEQKAIKSRKKKV